MSTPQDTHVSWDTETFRIGFNNPFPRMVCASFNGVQSGSRRLETRDFALPAILDVLRNKTSVLHNCAYDLAVTAVTFPETLPVIWEALVQGRVHDTIIREKYLNLAQLGTITGEEGSSGLEYGLGALVKKYKGIDRSAVKDDEDSVRLNYDLVDAIPLEDWPPEYVDYALDDASDTTAVYLSQETRRHKFKEDTGIDPLPPALCAHRVMSAFALAMTTLPGMTTDPEEIERIREHYESEYQNPDLRGPLIEAGLIKVAEPPMPYANGQLDHVEGCKKPKDKSCGCPVKMKLAVAESCPKRPLHERVWALAVATEGDEEPVEAWAAPKLVVTLADTGHLAGKAIKLGTVPDMKLPADWALQVDNAWLETYADMDPVLSLYKKRKEFEKIVTSYIPSLYWAEGYEQCPYVLPGREGRLDGKKPVSRVYGPYRELKETGRCSSSAATQGRGRNTLVLYPSMNVQQADPRMRGCIIPSTKGWVLFSIDYSGMELGTWAQTCMDLFGHSSLADRINAGQDAHAFLGAQIAGLLDSEFASLCDTTDKDTLYENFKSLSGLHECQCSSQQFLAMFPGASWAAFYRHYRTMAKPAGLGYPGGLGPKNLRALAKSTYGLDISMDEATKLREVWKDTCPEAQPWLDHINKQCIDPFAEVFYEQQPDGRIKKRQRYCYTSPLGMYRSDCTYTSCANGKGLQTRGAEGALLGLCYVSRECTVGDLAGRVIPTAFLHDEVVGEIDYTDPAQATADIAAMQAHMVSAMSVFTPDVKADTEACLMYRWSKAAKPVFKDGILVPWAPEEKEGKA